MTRRGLIVALAVVLRCTSVEASPETVIKFDNAAVGSEEGARFGSEVACSSYDASKGIDSIVAVGAPNAAAGEGRVYVYNPLRPTTPRQIIEPLVGAISRGFGSAIEFIDDISGDGFDDLVIGASGDELNPVGQVFAFVSSYSEGIVRYVGCGSVSGPLGFGSALQAVTSSSQVLTSSFVAGNRRDSRIDGVSVTFGGDGACTFALSGEFSASGGADSRFGSSLAQVGVPQSDGSQGVALVVAAPGEGQAGVVHTIEPGSSGFPIEAQSSSLESYGSGSVVSAQRGGSLYAAGVPRDRNSRGSVGVHRVSDRSDQVYCSIANPVEENSGTFGSNVHVVGAAFLELDPNARDAVIFRSAENETGGALNLLGVSELGCSVSAPVNNCQRDYGQEQGSALAGGVHCGVWRNGRVQRLFVSGSPGWRMGRGRVDIAFEDGVQPAPLPCDYTLRSVLAIHQIAEDTDGDPIGVSPTATVSPSVTAEPSVTPTQLPDTLTPIPTVVATVGQTATPTAEPTTTETSVPVTATVTPEPTASIPSQETEVPQPTIGAVVTARDTGPAASDGGISDGTSNLDVRQETPIGVGPGTTGLPAPQVFVASGEVAVKMPQVTPQLSAAQRTRAIRELQKKRGVSKNRAAQLLDNPNNLVVTYIIHYMEVTSGRRFALIQSAYADGPSRRAAKKRQLRARKNDVTLRNLRPGASYRVYYTVEISTARPRSILGVSRPSAAVTFTAP